MRDLLKHFEKWVQMEGPQVGPSTAAKYRRIARSFFADHPHPTQVSRRAILAWREDLIERQAPSTVNASS